MTATQMDSLSVSQDFDQDVHDDASCPSSRLAMSGLLVHPLFHSTSSDALTPS